MKMDIKSWVIIILLALITAGGLYWYFKPSNNTVNEKLEQQIELIQHQRDSLKLERDSLKIVNLKNDSIKTYFTDQFNQSKESYKKLELQYITISDNLNTKVKQIEITKQYIKSLEQDPIKRQDTALINSLKNKLK